MNPIQRLNSALSGRYLVDRELGRGGMATVYLAQDLKHHRPVALKVLHSQVAAVLGTDRFLREIETAATLNHPHILPLFDSGDVGEPGAGKELFWYAMPLVEGESLRDRLSREVQLPLADALQITLEVADALSYAHARGIVHRDIKPENILLANGHALVADFGIARALGAAGGEKLTETGLAIGTPAYMSPEQALGEAVDARGDLYALGCVLYEMLVGEPPYTGPTAQAILARRLSEPVPSLRTIRENLPEQVERAVLTALARTPADRFTTANELVAALSAPAAPIEGRRSLSHSSRRMPIGVLVALTVLGVAAAVRWWPAPPPALDRGLVALVPFRVSGNDPSLAYLGEGMMDLLAAKLNGDAGPRAVDPRSVMRRWNQEEGNQTTSDREALDVAREMGVGMVILGSVIGTPGRLVLSAAVLDVETGRTRQHATVEGAQDSLPSMVDQLAVKLLALSAGEESQRLTSLASASLPAVRAYLSGRAAARAGRWAAAVEQFNQALDLDSAFALAAMNLASASLWLDGSEIGRGRGLAWAARDRLSLRDRSLLEAQRADRLRTWQAFVQKFPDVPEAWSTLGDVYYHNGPLLGITDSPQLALDAFRRAIALDPDTTAPPFAEPMMHLANLALATGDTAGAKRLLSRLLASDSTLDGAPSQQLTLAYLSGDTEKVTQLRGEFPRLSWPDLFEIVRESQQNETKIPNAQPALEAVRHMPEAEVGELRLLAHSLALNRGRPHEARVDGEPGDFRPGGNLRVRISDAIYWGGDTSIAATAAESLARLVAAPPPPTTDRKLHAYYYHAYYYDVCMLEQWRLAHDDLRTASESVSRLRAAALVPGIAFPEEHERCADLLDAWEAVLTHKPDALQRLLRVDSLQVQEPSVGVVSSAIMASNLIMARLWRIQGDWPRAEAAARRRYTGLQPMFLSTHLLEEGRAAAQAGHREVAVRALRHYLALRYDPEPSVKPEVEAVRTELAQLLSEPRPLGQRP